MSNEIEADDYRCNTGSWGFLTFTRILLVPCFKDELSLGIYLLCVLFLKMAVSS